MMYAHVCPLAFHLLSTSSCHSLTVTVRAPLMIVRLSKHKVRRSSIPTNILLLLARRFLFILSVPSLLSLSPNTFPSSVANTTSSAPDAVNCGSSTAKAVRGAPFLPKPEAMPKCLAGRTNRGFHRSRGCRISLECFAENVLSYTSEEGRCVHLSAVEEV